MIDKAKQFVQSLKILYSENCRENFNKPRFSQSPYTLYKTMSTKVLHKTKLKIEKNNVAVVQFTSYFNITVNFRE